MTASRSRVVVLGAGLSGLAAARDLMHNEVDVLVLEARDRPGGRLEQVRLDDGRLVQMGGEVVGNSHTAYLSLAAELGLDMRPAYAAERGQVTWDLLEGPVINDEPTWLDSDERADVARIRELIEELRREVDPAEPLAHPDAPTLDSLSVGDWLRSNGASPGARRLMELEFGARGGGSIERYSTLGYLRHLGTFEGEEYTMTVAEGSAAVAWKMVDELDGRIRLDSLVRSIAVTPAGVDVKLDDGTSVASAAVICTIPAGPLRNVTITGISDARLASLRRQRHSCTSKIVVAFEDSFWQRAGASGIAESERTFGVSWAQGDGVLSITVQPELIGHHLTSPPDARRAEIIESLARMWGPEARNVTEYHQRDWVTDPFTLGYAARYAPGDLTAIGNLHGTHEHPFYVAGSDHWYAGTMEGAVQTGRSTAAAVLEKLT